MHENLPTFPTAEEVEADFLFKFAVLTVPGGLEKIHELADSIEEENSAKRSIKCSAATKRRWTDLEYKLMCKLAFATRDDTARFEALERWFNSEEFAAHCKRQGKRLVEQMKDPVRWAEARRKANETYNSPAYKEKARALRKAEYAENPALAEAISLRQIEKFKDPAEREAARIRAMEIWDRPGYRELMQEALRLSHNTPEYRKLRKAIAKQMFIDNPALREAASKERTEWWKENYALGCAIQKEIQNRPEIKAVKSVIMTARMYSAVGERMKAKGRATRSDPKWRESNRIRMQAARENNPVWQKATVDNINAGRKLMQANAAKRHEEILEQMLSVLSGQKLRYGNLMNAMRLQFGIGEDVAASVLRKASIDGKIYKEPGKMGVYRRT